MLQFVAAVEPWAIVLFILVLTSEQTMVSFLGNNLVHTAMIG